MPTLVHAERGMWTRLRSFGTREREDKEGDIISLYTFNSTSCFVSPWERVKMESGIRLVV